jgi:polysaccharide export outer membrane protein
VLMVVGAIVAFPANVGAEGFGNSYGGRSDEAGQKASGQFAPAPKAQPQAESRPTQTVAPVVGSLGAPGFRSSGGYTIGPQDVLEILVFGVPELSGTLLVAGNGTIQLPLLGETPAAGRTARQLQSDLATRLGAEYLQNPQVLVTVKEFNSRSVTLTGEISKPGVYPLKGEMSLLQLVATAGGFAEGSDSTVLIMRNTGGKRAAAQFDISDIEKGKATDPALQAGDTVVAGSSVIKQAYKGFLKALPIAGAFMMF